MITISQNGLKYIRFNNLYSVGIEHAIFTRLGGVSQLPFASLNLGGTVGDDPEFVLENHQRVFAAIGRPFDQRYDVWQVHGTDIERANAPRPHNQPHVKADGILTDKLDLILLMRFADCVPIVLADPVRKVVGVVHAGWKGSLNMICAAAVSAMQDWYGCMSGNVLAGIGPAICQDCFEVGEDVYERFKIKFEQSSELFLKKQDGKKYIDLVRANQITLEKAGVRNIECANICTAHHLDD
ncbi:MAG: peptidoglycan editing factor PgeF, partial [Anaerolineaceae bacterium]|nr:peptidoglycan editing factor PgeF [Anaerolineaceae bacterium]